MTAIRLSPRCAAVLRFVREFCDTHGTFPTLADIGDEVGMFSPVAVLCHLRALERKGLLVCPFVDSRAVTADA